MSKKLRMIITSIYVKQDDMKNIENADLSSLQYDLKCLMSKRNDGKNCVSILRVFPTIASSNTANIELAAFDENVDLLATNIHDKICDFINEYLDLDFSHIITTHIMNPLIIRGDLS